MQEQQPIPGTVFHRQLPAGRGTLWPLFVGVVFAGLGLVVMALASAIVVLVTAQLLGYDFRVDPTDGIDAAELLAANLGLALQIPVAAGLMAGLYYVSPWWVWSNRPGIRWSRLGLGARVAAVVWSPFLVLGTVGAYVTRESPPGSAVVGFLAVVLLTTPLQAAGEECLFRGLLLQAVGVTKLSTWACCLSSGGLFAIAHLQFQPALFADRLFLGTVLAWLAIRTGGIEAGVAIHAVKNIAVLVPAGILGNVGDALDPTGVTWLPLAVDVVLLSVAVAWIVAASGPSRPPRSPPSSTP